MFAHTEAAAALQLTWADNSNNEDGFKIERAIGSGGTFSQIALAGVNVTSYTDSSVTTGTTYCYRVRAYNAAGDSSYSNAVCGGASAGTVNLSISKSGNGSGTVSSSPAGINCGATCTGSYATGTTVALTATAASNSVFAGWSGDADCSDGSVAMTAARSCTATFQRRTFTLSTNLVNTITSLGTGSGTVTSSPAGISCGTDCSEAYVSGTSVTLTATPASGSVFSGWSGACSGTGNCTLTITANTSAIATFAPQGVNLVVNKHGQGKVSSNPLGIDCGTSCSGSYVSGSSITLTPQADPGFTFLGWTGGGCSGLGSCTVALNANTTVAANFSTNIPVSVGVFRPSTREFILDLDGNGFFDGCNIDSCVANFGPQGNIPVTGPWTNAQTLLGLFDTRTAAWFLDLNGNGSLDGCEIDTCKYVYGLPGDRPIVGDWTGNGNLRLGLFRPSTRGWYFDVNGNEKLDSCKSGDVCVKSFGQAGDLPVVGDWTGNGKTKIGVFSPATAKWVLDLNGDNKLGRKCSGDRCISSFGAPGDLPVVGDWDGNGADNIGVFRPSTGEWLLDVNGNGVFDGCNVDTCLTFGQAGDIPVVGKW
jgi:hypothetical protein